MAYPPVAKRINLRACLLVGSAAKGTADGYSDLDVVYYAESLPDRQQFRSWLAKAGANQARPLGSGSPDGFADAFQLGGVQLQTSVTLASSLERLIDEVTAGGRPDDRMIKAVGGLFDAVPLGGAEQLEAWRDRAKYTDVRAQRCAQSHLDSVHPYWNISKQLAKRDAALFEKQCLIDDAFHILGALFAVNRKYFTSFQFKRMRGDLATMEHLPTDLADRLESILHLPRSAAGDELRALYRQTVGLVRAYIPDVDVTQAQSL